MIIGFAGRIGHGKDTAARRLIEQGYAHINFAATLKEEVLMRLPRTVSAILLLNRWPLPNDSHQRRHAVYHEKPLGIRELLQEYGTEVRRADDPDYWMKRWIEAVRIHGGPVVVTDMRFPNEARAVREADGITIRIERPGYPAFDDHITETALADWRFDAVIQNDGSQTDLWDRVDEVLAKYSTNS